MGYDVDVLIVGAGVAGFSAALEATERGARVAIIESQLRVGGSSALSGGYIYGAGTANQRAAGIDDDADAMYAHWLTMTQCRVRPELVRVLCDRSAGIIDGLSELGLEFELRQSGIDSVPRGHKTKGDGPALVEALERQVAERSVPVVMGAEVRSLRVQSGRVVGVTTDREDIAAPSTVLATGGFGQDRQLLELHYPDAAAAGNRLWSLAAPGSKGDGIRLGERVGAALEGANTGLLVPTPGFHNTPAVVHPWLLFVDGDGRRFIDESKYHSVLSKAILARGGFCWALFDESGRRHAEADPSWGGLFAGLDEPLTVTPELEAFAAGGLYASAGTIAGLAGAIGVDSQALEGAIHRYAAAWSAHDDREFFKPPDLLRSLSRPPFYAVRLLPALVPLTGYGLRIDVSARVLNRSDQVVPGLFAAGETTATLGDIYVASGASLLSALVFGQIAGSSAASS